MLVVVEEPLVIPPALVVLVEVEQVLNIKAQEHRRLLPLLTLVLVVAVSLIVALLLGQEIVVLVALAW
jgi:hypothetical protein